MDIPKLTAFFLAFASSVSAQSYGLQPYASSASAVLQNPCDRGPWPKVSIINGPNPHLAAYLQEMRPDMPIGTAYNIADQLCSDMSLVGDSVGLIARLSSLLVRHGY